MRPKTIKIALLIFVISIVTAISSTIFYIYVEPQVESSANLIVLSAIFILPYLILFIYIYKRKNWARYIWLIIFILGNVLIRGGHTTNYHYNFLAYFSYVQTLLQLVITILLFLPASNRWYKKTDQDLNE